MILAYSSQMKQIYLGCSSAGRHSLSLFKDLDSIGMPEDANSFAFTLCISSLVSLLFLPPRCRFGAIVAQSGDLVALNKPLALYSY